MLGIKEYVKYNIDEIELRLNEIQDIVNTIRDTKKPIYNTERFIKMLKEANLYNSELEDFIKLYLSNHNE